MFNLVEKKVVIVANEFSQCDLAATIVEIDSKHERILLSLDVPLTNGSERYLHAIASVRLARDDVDALANTGVLGCGVTWVPEGKFSRADPFNLSWWRGGAAAITDLLMA